MRAVKLTESGQTVYAQLVAEYGTSAAVKQLAQTAARFWDVAQQAGEIVRAEGLVLELGRGRFRHPALQAETAARLAYLAAVRVLKQRPRLAKPNRPTRSEALLRDRPLRVLSGKGQKYLR
jgi:hypothetical protein